MKPEHVERWRAARAKGRWRYILLYGVLAWGIPMFVVMTFVLNPGRAQNAGLLALQLVIWLVGGAMFGTTMWYVNERNFRKAIADAKTPAP